MSKFREWVERWQIGPGMNDPDVSQHFATIAVSDRWLQEAAGIMELNRRGLYSGFDGTVEDGWVPILDRLAADLVQMGWDRRLDQVKEKFGTLRFYVPQETEEMSRRIEEAEDESARTCEDCGRPGVLRFGGWLKTLCDGCEEKRKR